MKIVQHNQFCEDTIYASIRMNKQEYLALREYMHTKPGDDIWFPYGTTIVKHGYGWYYMSPTASKRAIEKMAFAMKVVKMFLRAEEEKVEEEIKKLAPLMLEIDLRVATFSNSHSVGEFQYMSGRQSTAEPLPASSNQLQKLANKFSKERRT